MVVNGFEWCNCLDGSWQPWSNLGRGQMDALPQVGQKYQHKKWGEVEVVGLIKSGRGYAVFLFQEGWPDTIDIRLKDFQKATT